MVLSEMNLWTILIIETKFRHHDFFAGNYVTERLINSHYLSHFIFMIP
jgi:hypothetical protein